jgi:hypothetical protein
MSIFIKYSSHLEIAAQEAKVVFDLAFVSCSFVSVDYSCRFNEGKVVFNALDFLFSNIKDQTYLFREDAYFNGISLRYPLLIEIKIVLFSACLLLEYLQF